MQVEVVRRVGDGIGLGQGNGPRTQAVGVGAGHERDVANARAGGRGEQAQRTLDVGGERLGLARGVLDDERGVHERIDPAAHGGRDGLAGPQVTELPRHEMGAAREPVRPAPAEHHEPLDPVLPAEVLQQGGADGPGGAGERDDHDAPTNSPRSSTSLSISSDVVPAVTHSRRIAPSSGTAG